MPKTIFEYRGRKPIWCSYCGNYSLLTGIFMSLAELSVEPRDLVIASGIGCSSRLPGFVKNYGFHSLHGRALPIATGVKEANPALTVLAVAGDGDILGIGGGHLLHAVRRNADITLILVDNGLYGMTKGQPSPTTPFGVATSTTPYGNPEAPLDPVTLALALGAGFVARGYTGNIERLNTDLTAAISHKGFSIVHAISPCPTFNARETYKYYSTRITEVPAGHDPADKAAAMALAAKKDEIHIGLYYRSDRPAYEDLLEEARVKAGKKDLNQMIERFRPVI
jgi:2-oxoglutarate ferredoxin oxidoreductase subunit beta